MATYELHPETLLNAIEAHLPRPLVADEEAIAVEVSHDHLEFVTLRPASFGGYVMGTGTPIPASRWPGRLDPVTPGDPLPDGHLRLLAALLADVADFTINTGALLSGVVLGTLAANETVRDILADTLGLDFARLDDADPALGTAILPRGDALRQHLVNRPIVTPHGLVVPMYMLDTNVNTGRPQLIVERHQIHAAGATVYDGDHLGEVRLGAPSLGQELLVCFEEFDEEAGTPARMVAYVVRPFQRQFSAIVLFQDGDWTVLWEGAEEVVGRHVRSDRILPPVVRISEAQPNVLLMVESTLGVMRQLHLTQGNVSLAEETADFAVVRDLCSAIIQRLDLPDARFLVGFYGDEESVPQELEQVMRRADPVIAWLPAGPTPRFMAADDVLSEIQTGFMAQQTASVDWHKALEQALQFVNREVEWDDADRVVVWIGQSPPHAFDGPDGPALERPGFTTPIDFETELAESRRLGIQHFALFVGDDIPTQALEMDSRAHWARLGGDGAHFMRTRCTHYDPDHFGEICREIDGFAHYRYSPLMVIEQVPGQRKVLPLPFRLRRDHPLIVYKLDYANAGEEEL